MDPPAVRRLVAGFPMAQPFQSTTDIYPWRRTVPAALRTALSREHKRSLKTCDSSEAKVRSAKQWTDIERCRCACSD
ncbi:DUF6538 domain-containing protein [Variovorax sp. KBW07]|uniref:DUF6538 domain-containing protein n=1 Tax=Variovorax sp. KBW07 TaxID=2153358 RepID=UPI0034D972FF